MAQCKMCDKKGFFLTVNKVGVCRTCEIAMSLELTQAGRIMEDCVRIIDDSNNMKTRLTRCDLLISTVQKLLKYEEKGVLGGEQPPSSMLRNYTKLRDQIVVESVTEAVHKILLKAGLVPSPRTKISEISKALLKIVEVEKDLRDRSKLLSLKCKVESDLHKAKLEAYLEEAKKAEFKGQKKKAIDQYKEALYFIQNDDIPDGMQIKEIAAIQGKLKELENEP